MRRILTIILIFFILEFLSVSLGFAEGIEAITRPSMDVTLSFVRPGKVDKILAKEGEVVRAGQVLVRQEDEAERVQLEQLKAQADNTSKIQAAGAQLEKRKEDLKKIEEAAKRNAASDLELKQARLDAVIADLSLVLAKFDHEQDRLKYLETRHYVDRMQIVSPIDGWVEQLFVKAGESVEGLAKVIRVVKVDPLWIDVPVPLAQARILSRGRTARVDFPDKKTGLGRVIHIGAVAYAASDTLMVRVELANPGPRPAGEHVRVFFISSPVPEKDRPKYRSTSNPQLNSPFLDKIRS